MGCIYRIYCKQNGKSYIGQTEDQTPCNRYAKHWYNALSRNLPYPLYCAFRKYGIDSFYIEIIRVCLRNELDNLEAYYAQEYQTYIWENGYNLAQCGRGQPRDYKHKEESRRKMSECKKGKLTGVMDVINREKIGRANSGKRLTEESKQKVSMNRRGIAPRPRLSETDVREIRENKSKLTQKQLSEKYNIGWRSISLIQCCKTYKHVQ
jgi:group I intron endonuclease